MECYLKREELAEILGVHVQTIIRWEKRGLPHIRMRRVIRYNIHEVNKWLGAIEPTSIKVADNDRRQ